MRPKILFLISCIIIITSLFIVHGQQYVPDPGVKYNDRSSYDNRYASDRYYSDRDYNSQSRFSDNSFFGSGYGGSYTSHQVRPDFETYYGGGKYTTYWPILGDRETCEARQDFMLQVTPVGCQPAVVRSDLLADQNVPIFCQLNAVQLNPLIDVRELQDITFSGTYPPEVVSAGFHPSRAALRTRDRLLGSPLMNDIGYVVVVLKRQPDERALPDFVNVSLRGRMRYSSGNALGIGRAEFVLKPTSDTEWEREKVKQSFWKGRYFVRLEEADPNYATVSVYSGDRLIFTTRVRRGEISREFFVPGFYCRAGLQVVYDGFVSAERKATLEIENNQGVDTLDVYEGSRILDGQCTVRRIDIQEDRETGRVEISCPRERIILALKSLSGDAYSAFHVNGKGIEPRTLNEENGEYAIDLRAEKDAYRKGEYVLDKEGALIKSGESGKDSTVVIKADESYDASVREEDKEWIKHVRNGLLFYREKKKENPSYKIGDFVNRNVSAHTFSLYRNAIDSYELVVNDYQNERDPRLSEGEFYGERALSQAISLAEALGQDRERIRLTKLYLETYKGTNASSSYLRELNRITKLDSSSSSDLINSNIGVRSIRLTRLEKPQELAYADFFVEHEKIRLEEKQTKNITLNGIKRGEITLDSLNADEARVSVSCIRPHDTRSDSVYGRDRYLMYLNGPGQRICDGLGLRFDNANVKTVARIRLLPTAGRTQTDTNVTVRIGIEKRAIELSPDKTIEKIERLNESIAKWEETSKKLGNVVSGLKGACFATSAALSFKTFLGGLGGEALARQQVMNGEGGWKLKCQDLVAQGTYPTLDACYIGEAGKIEKDVRDRAAALTRLNDQIQKIQSQHTIPSGIFGNSVNSDNVRTSLGEAARQRYGEEAIDLSQLREKWYDANGNVIQSIKVKDLLTPENVQKGVVSTDAIRMLMLNLELSKNAGVSEQQQAITKAQLLDVAERTNQNRIIQQDVERAERDTQRGLPPPLYVSAVGQENRETVVLPLGSELQKKANFGTSITHVATARVSPSKEIVDGRPQNMEFTSGLYVLGLDVADSRQGVYTIREIRRELPEKPGTYETINNVAGFSTTYKVGNVHAADRLDYVNEIVSRDRKVRYFENEPYRGMPALIPFDIKQGWYAATQQQLPVFGGIGAFDASGRVTSFSLCNVGKNGRIEFETGLGDDICRKVDLNTGQPLGVFPGLTETQGRTLVTRAIRAIEDAARAYTQGVKYVTIGGERFEVGEPTIGTPATQCQDFMSPRDCHLLFNVCDPVICPASRCNLGGQYPVADVIQTGIVGSALLCLPNIREGIVVPVCLTGIQAGIDGLISIMKSHRDCLRENLETGRMVGICDEIYSIYLCEFLWRQVAPAIHVVLPRLVEIAYGQGVRGGGEYLTVMSAWNNMQRSMNYFTQSYAVNSLRAFNVRSIEEAGTPFCKAFISAKAPSAFKTLIEPDSPPQFHAWFDSQRYTDVTVPATAQYKVFYHIFAGKDQGVHYSVYLRNPPQLSFYSTPPQIVVATGFVPRGQPISQTRDFTAPEGYKELCVRINDNEECGFKQVSTSFAINYVRDAVVKEQITNNRISSERECIGGSPSLGGLLQPNLQSGVEEAAFPQIYERGIIRICSTHNPGSSVDPTRFIDVGICDNPKITCWLDKRSVDRAITANNAGLRNQTLQELEQGTREKLEREGVLYSFDEGDVEVQNLEEALRAFKSKKDVSTSEGEQLINRVDLIFPKLGHSYQKAIALLIKGEVYDSMTRASFAKDRANEREKIVPQQQKPSPRAHQFTLGEYVSEDTRALLLNGAKTDYVVDSTVDGYQLLYIKNSVIIDLGKVTDKGVVSVDREGAKTYISSDEIEKLQGAVVKDLHEFTSAPTSQPSREPEAPQTLPDNTPTKETTPLPITQPIIKYYSIQGNQNLQVYDVLLDGKNTGIYIERNTIYGYSSSKNSYFVVGSIRDRKLNIIINDNAKANIDATTVQHLNTLNGKSYTDLADGKIAAEEAPVVTKRYEILRFEFYSVDKNQIQEPVTDRGVVSIGKTLGFRYEHDCDRLDISYTNIDDKLEQTTVERTEGEIVIGLLQDASIEYYAHGKCMKRESNGQFSMQKEIKIRSTSGAIFE